jgi:FixJ family two-component response regulator
LILDIHLGGMSGLELLSRLRKLGHDLPVLLITAHDDAQAREAAVQGGCVAYLRKPLDAKVLLEEVATAIKRAA